MHDIPRQTLCTIIRDHGRNVADDPKRCEALLLDLCGEHHREINILISAMDERVASDLLNSSPNTPHKILLPQLAQRIHDNTGIALEYAEWAVKSWALALDIIAESTLPGPHKTTKAEHPKGKKRKRGKKKGKKKGKSTVQEESEGQKKKECEDTNEPEESPPLEGMNDTPRQALCAIIRDYGRDVADDPKRCKALLLDLCGEHRREINILISAMNEGVASNLLNLSPNIPHKIVLPQLAQRIHDNTGIALEYAKWAVESWALALGVIAESALKPPVPPQPPVAPAPIRRINPLYPVTIAEWRDEEKLCTTNFGTPAGYWCYVRPGNYAIGGWNKGDDVATITLPGFWIAKYPITVRQYRQFIDTGGYATQSYWTPNGWTWKQGYNDGKGRTRPYQWDENRFRADDQPVVGLWWYEATAFAAWLDAQLTGTAPHGARIRLPTEAEWEAAAAYDARGQRRTYPWGEQEPDATLADFGKDWKTDKPAPIGMHAAGAAACAAQNMGGSVWEYTTSDYGTFPATSGDVVSDFGISTLVPIRGGSWYNNRAYVCCAARFRRPHVYYYDGLRLLLLPPR